MKKIRFLSNEDFIKLSICDVVAVTGPMAAGKNYICNQLADHGYVSIDADIIAHKAIQQATPKILSTFKEYADAKGVVLENPDGSLNRRALGSIVFENSNLLAKQENIVYPIITNIINEFISNHANKKIIINATVLYKIPELMEKCDLILYITAPLFTRLKRAKLRDNLPFKQIYQRFHNQKGLFNKYKATGKEIIIINNKNH